MDTVTQLLDGAGDPKVAAELLPLVYEELRKLAAARLAIEPVGQTLQPTALVHEAYLRLVGSDPKPPRWNGRGHFYAAAAEAMRRILVEAARRKGRQRHGGGLRRVHLDQIATAVPDSEDDVVALSDALDDLAKVKPQAAAVVKLRYFGGLTGREAAEAIGVSPRKADQLWAYARAWLLDRLAEPPG